MLGDESNTAVPSDIINAFNKTQQDALHTNAELLQEWTKKHGEYITLLSFLGTLPDKLSSEVMVPIGKKALMKGKVVHTNEILVSLGDNWFVKQSAKLASEICNRRIQLCSNTLKDLEREANMLSNRQSLLSEQNAFGNEIIEPYDEVEEAKWRERHREKEKRYREELREQRNKISSEPEISVPTDEELWNTLERLELQEQLEEELERLNATQTDLNDLPVNSTPAIESTGDNTSNKVQVESADLQKQKRKVSFAEVNQYSNDENEDNICKPFIIEFSHSVTEDVPYSNGTMDNLIESPSDICKLFPSLTKKSILKSSPKPDVVGDTIASKVNNVPQASHISDGSIIEKKTNRREGIVIRDVAECTSQDQATIIEPARQVSRFKAARRAAAVRSGSRT